MLLYIPWIVMFLGFVNTKISNKRKLLFLSNLTFYYFTHLSLFGEKSTLPYFLGRINRTLIAIPFVGRLEARRNVLEKNRRGGFRRI